jgi:hypothetical protein
VTADARGILELLFYHLAAKTVIVAFGPGAAFTFVFALVVPRDATFVVGMRIGEACCIVQVFEFAVKT